MKKVLLSYICFTLPFRSNAQGTIFGDTNPLNYLIVFLLIFLIIIIVYIFVDGKKSDKRKATHRKGQDSNEKGNQLSNKENPLKKENKNLKKEIQSLKKENKNLNDEVTKKNVEINLLKTKISTIREDSQTEIQDLKDEVSKKNVEINLLKTKISSIREDSQTEKNLIPEKDDKEKQNGEKEEEITAKNNSSNPNSLDIHSDFNELTVLNGILVKAKSEHTVYYRSWRKGGQILFEFVNNERTRKAINNRTIIIEPFCIKLEKSKSPDISEEVDTKTPGILNEDYTIIKKAEIIYK